MRTSRNIELEQATRVENAVLIQALWAERAGVNGDVYHSQASRSVKTSGGESLKSLIKSKLEEWAELVVATLDRNTNQANRLLELADLQAYSYNYVGHVWKKNAGDGETFSLERAKAVNSLVARRLLTSKVHSFQDEGSAQENELEKIMDYLTHLGIEHLVHHFEFVGYHPNGSSLAEVQMWQLEDGIKRAVSSLHEAVEYGRVTKTFLKHVVERVLASTERLPHIIRPDASLEFLLPMFGSLDLASKYLFAYSTLHELVESIYARDTIIHPETNEAVLVSGKNARNYPPLEALPAGWTLGKVRELRNYFPDSILPSDFILGVDTPEAYLSRKTPDGASAEVRDFEKLEIR